VDLELLRTLVQDADTKILLLVMDGLGDIESRQFGETALEVAQTPNLDRLATRGICGLHLPVGSGISPGSGAAHLALFGYAPYQYRVGRGVLEALGIAFDLQPGDIALRGNFCAVDDQGALVDGRARRMSTSKNRGRCERLRAIRLPGVETFVETIKGHRFLLVLRGDDLSPDVGDTDPQRLGELPLAPEPRSPDARHTASLVADFVAQAAQILSDGYPANMVILRGCGRLPHWPDFHETTGLRAAAIASHPMYLGLASLLGMATHRSGGKINRQIRLLEEIWQDYDFFYLHVKRSDIAGEDGDFGRKVGVIESVDRRMPRLTKLAPDVLIVTGDHSTPAAMHSHSWHPVPVVLWSENSRRDAVTHFGETACIQGALGPRLPAEDILPIALANAGRLRKLDA